MLRIAIPGRGSLDLLVLGHAGHSNLGSEFLGTSADMIVRHAPRTVILVR